MKRRSFLKRLLCAAVVAAGGPVIVSIAPKPKPVVSSKELRFGRYFSWGDDLIGPSVVSSKTVLTAQNLKNEGMRMMVNNMALRNV